jgi:O-methyltransferase
MHHFTRKRLANLLWPRFSPSVEVLNRNAQMLATIRSFGPAAVDTFATREQLYSAVNKRLSNQAITYLEFGVWEGESMRAWTGINTNQNSRFYGFDSFEGLPEEWVRGFGHATQKGGFHLGGVMPTIPDPRVTLVKGWFQQTLGKVLRDTQISHPIVINNDSDLHSSTHYTLSMLDPILQPGDIIIFDEYSSPANEYLAWEQYKSAFMRKAECIAMSDHWTQTAFVLA